MSLFSASRLALAAGLIALAAPASAYTVLDNGSEVTGFSGIEYEGEVYDLTLNDGSCNDAYGDCTDSSNLPPALVGNLTTFIEFLIANVIVDTDDYAIDSEPTTLFGCSYEEGCVIAFPTMYLPGNNVTYATYLNDYAEGGDEDNVTSSQFLEIDTDLGDRTAFVYGVLSLGDAPAPVPAPAAGLLLPAGLAAFAAFARRRKSV